MLCVDGTFSVVPHLYFALCSLFHKRIMYVSIYFLNIKKITGWYLNLFMLVIFSLCFELRPKFIKTDSQLASFDALKSNFTDSIISSCTLHLGQWLRKPLGIFIII